MCVKFVIWSVPDLNRVMVVEQTMSRRSAILILVSIVRIVANRQTNLFVVILVGRNIVRIIVDYIVLIAINHRMRTSVVTHVDRSTRKVRRRDSHYYNFTKLKFWVGFSQKPIEVLIVGQI